MRRILAAVVVGLVLAVGPAWADGEVSSYRIGPKTKKSISMLDIMNRTAPFISIYAVYPPVSDCMSQKCWPVADFFLYNPKATGGQDITVECDALSRSGALLAKGSVTLQLAASKAAISSVVLENADFDQFAEVDCRVVDVAPNAL